MCKKDRECEVGHTAPVRHKISSPLHSSYDEESNVVNYTAQ